MLTIHICIALMSTLFGGHTLFTVFAQKKMNVTKQALALAALLVLSVTTGLLLALQSGASVLSVCDNLLLYVTGFSVVFASLAYTRGFSTVQPYMTWSYAYATALPVALIAFGF
jgi:hypothetical protein